MEAVSWRAIGRIEIFGGMLLSLPWAGLLRWSLRRATVTWGEVEEGRSFGGCVSATAAAAAARELKEKRGSGPANCHCNNPCENLGIVLSPSQNLVLKSQHLGLRTASSIPRSFAQRLQHPTSPTWLESSSTTSRSCSRRQTSSHTNRCVACPSGAHGRQHDADYAHQDNGHRDHNVVRRYMIQKPEDYNKYNRLCGVSTHRRRGHHAVPSISLILKNPHAVRPPTGSPPLTYAA